MSVHKLYVAECDWCGEEQFSALSKKPTKKQFQNFLKKQGWIFVIRGKYFQYSFCRKGCYKKWYDDGG